MSLITKHHLSSMLKVIKQLLSQKLGKEDSYTDGEILQLLSDTAGLSPMTENGKLLVEGDKYLIL